MSNKPAIHCVRFDDRAIALVLEPDGGYECETYANHALSLGMAVAEIACVARSIADRGAENPQSPQRLLGLLTGIEVLGSLIQAIAHDVAVEERTDRQSQGKKES